MMPLIPRTSSLPPYVRTPCKQACISVCVRVHLVRKHYHSHSAILNRMRAQLQIDPSSVIASRPRTRRHRLHFLCTYNLPYLQLVQGILALVHVKFLRLYVLLYKFTLCPSSTAKLGLDCRFATLHRTSQLDKMLFHSLRRLPRQMRSGEQSGAGASSQEQSGAVRSFGLMRHTAQ